MSLYTVSNEQGNRLLVTIFATSSNKWEWFKLITFQTVSTEKGAKFIDTSNCFFQLKKEPSYWYFKLFQLTEKEPSYWYFKLFQLTKKEPSYWYFKLFQLTEKEPSYWYFKLFQPKKEPGYWYFKLFQLKKGAISYCNILNCYQPCGMWAWLYA